MKFFHRTIASWAAQARPFVPSDAGNMSLIFAASLLPIVGTVALAVDYGRANQLRNQMQIAADGAALAAATAATRDPELTAGDMEAVAKAAFKANAGMLDKPTTFSTVRTDDGISVVASTSTNTLFARAIGIDTLDIEVASEVQAGAKAMEMALVLDNTGSMRDHMGDLRLAAKRLVETVHGGAGRQNSNTKVALVPYVGAVNIGNGGTQMAWMDTAADAQFHGVMFRNRSIGWKIGCYNYTGPGGPGDPDPGPGGGGGDRSSLDSLLKTFAAVGREVIGVRSAHAAPPAPLGYEWTWGNGNDNSEDCFLVRRAKTSHFTLFDGIPGASWKGCVEARPAPYDVDDTAPDAGDPDTMFVPYFWPDEPDDDPDWTVFPNNFMPDGNLTAFIGDDPLAPTVNDLDWREMSRGRNVFKYDGVTPATLDEVAPFTKGPNQACPDPIVPLTNNPVTVNSAIDALMHWEGSGTVTSEGVAWGLRVLSPGEPFTEGAAYGEVQKIMVLMTDGKNSAAEQASGTTKTDYTAYGYLRGDRISPWTYAAYNSTLDDRTLEACTNAKAAGITVYAITFGVMDPYTQALYTACASQPPFYYSATTVADLHQAFEDIGGRIMALRLTK